MMMDYNVFLNQVLFFSFLTIPLLASTGVNRSDKLNSSPVKQNDAEKIRITILYDNYEFTNNTKAAWGFSCLIEGLEETILFDTGADPEILMKNVSNLKIDLQKVDKIVISHNHWDHTGGLDRLLDLHSQVEVHMPFSTPAGDIEKIEHKGASVISSKNPLDICSNCKLSGESGNEIKEQSLILETPKGLIIITGCSHPGIVEIVKNAKALYAKPIYFVFGGFHLKDHSAAEVKEVIHNLQRLGVEKVGPTHCTGEDAIQLFSEIFGDDYVQMGTGRVVEIKSEM